MTPNLLPRRSRRAFLRVAGVAGTLACAPAIALRNAMAAAEDYKAIVFVFLHGGNDGANTVIPISGGEYANYAACRGRLAIGRSDLVDLTAPGGASFALHPALAPLEPLWSAGRMAIALNVGPLTQPGLRRADYQRDPTLLPTGLLAHDVQTAGWSSADPRGVIRHGWAGRALDAMAAMNSGTASPTAIAIGGMDPLLEGDVTRGFAIPLWTRFGIDPIGNVMLEAARRHGLAAILASAESGNTLVDAVRRQTNVSLDGATLLTQALTGTASAADRHFAGLTGDLPTSLNRIARLIEQRNRLGAKRQIFLAGLGPFDTHGPQPAQHALLLGSVARSIRALYDALAAMGVANDVTIATISEFGRTLRSNGQGTDHGWGNHHWVVGGAVRGGRTFGVGPAMGFGTADDLDQDGRWIPTLSIEQYMASVISWFGVPASAMDTVFPNFARFGPGPNYFA